MKTLPEIIADMRENARTDDTEDQIVGQSLNWYADQLEESLADQKTFGKHVLCDAIQKLTEYLLNHCRDAEAMPTLLTIRDYAHAMATRNIRNCDRYLTEQEAWDDFSRDRGGADASTEEYEEWLFERYDGRAE